ncbi:MAG TPA: hypothetical protein VJ276_03225 [Thermoanaerobaculia bacterium]|nr:hypothetical protein [Thermoanaerobaculia bacterium]
MRRRGAAFALLLIAAGSALGASMDLSVSLNILSDTRLESKAFVQYANNKGYLVSGVPITAYHTIVNGGVAYTAPPRSATPWSHSIQTPNPAVPGICYTGRVTASGTGPDGYATSSLGSYPICFYGPPPPKLECPGDPSCPPTGSACLPEDVECQLSPLVINLGNGKYDLAGDDDPVVFDLDADGTADRITWTARGNGDMGFLALERTGNDAIDNGAELFGDHTPLPGGEPAANGFEALAQYDENGDGVIDASDPVWPRLTLWIDVNHDGRSSASETVRLSATNIISLEVRYRRTNRTDDDGNVFRYAAKLHQRGAGDRTYYDVYFNRVP